MSNKQDNMSLVEFAEKTSLIPLTEWQKKFLEMYEQAKREDKELIIIPGSRSGKRIIYQIIDEWYISRELKEHRCSCGRLLGRFAGQAEVKCSKCGKMNVIGAEKHGD